MATISTVLKPNSDGNLTYNAGHILTGFVEISVVDDIKLKGIYIKVYGSAKTCWGSGNNEVPRSDGEISERQYNEFETYVNSKMYVYGEENGPLQKLKPGKYKHNFFHKLSKHLPYSLKLNHGTISYCIETFLDISKQFISLSVIPFKVIRYDDVTLDPELKLPQNLEEKHAYCCLFCKSKPLRMSVHIPRSGYLCGEEIPITINYVNNSNVDILSTTITLMQNIAYTSNRSEFNKRIERVCVATKIVRGVGKYKSKIITANLKIPDNILSSNSKFCKLISINYQLHIKANEDAVSFLDEIILSITIGRILTNTNASNFRNPNFSLQPSAPAEEDDDMPPSFLEAIRATEQSTSSLDQVPLNAGWNL